MPIEDPATLLHLGQTQPIRAAELKDVATLLETSNSIRRWDKLTQELGEREGTVLDLDDQFKWLDRAEAAILRTYLPAVSWNDLHSVFRGDAGEIRTLAVEGWIRRQLSEQVAVQFRMPLVKLWCFLTADMASPEAVRRTADAAMSYMLYDWLSTACNQRGTRLQSMVRTIRGHNALDSLWADTLEALERESFYTFTFWRNAEEYCYVHQDENKRCPLTEGKENWAMGSETEKLDEWREVDVIESDEEVEWTSENLDGWT